MPTPFQN